MKKTSTIANFNCKFGEKPMLPYFKEIIYPAFTNEHSRSVGDDKYFFEGVKLENSKGRYILQGVLVKKTKLEIKTEYNDGELEYVNKFYDSAPISIFSLFLDNHRFIYTTNQKGSPDIRSFSATIKEFIKREVSNYNLERKKEDRIIQPKIDIVSIPEKSSIEEKLKQVKKIKKLSFKFFNLNGDMDTTDAYNWMLSELDAYGSKTGAITINSPTNFDVVSDRIGESKGFAKVNLNVDYKNGGSGKLDNESISEKFTIDVPEESTINTVAMVTLDTFKNNELLNSVTKENQRIYDKNKSIIDSLD